MNMSTPMSPKPLVNATCKLGKQGCFEDGKCHALGNCEHKIVTNADRIRAMSDEELVQFINHFNICDLRTNEECKMSYCACCEVCVMDWLKQPAEA